MRLFVMIAVMLPVSVLVLAACAPSEPDDSGVPTPAPNDAADVMPPGPVHVGDMSLEEAINERRSIRSFRNEPLSLDDLAQLLWAAQGVSDESRGLRTAPSAGATYPLETFVVVGDVTGLDPAVYRYHPDTHRLLLSTAGDVRDELANAALAQQFIADAPVTVVFAGIYARTAQRYGDRAERYVHMEAGHAAQNLALQATALGLGTVPVGAFRDERVTGVLGLTAEEVPLYLLPIGHP